MPLIYKLRILKNDKAYQLLFIKQETISRCINFVFDPLMTNYIIFIYIKPFGQYLLIKELSSVFFFRLDLQIFLFRIENLFLLVIIIY